MKSKYQLEHLHLLSCKDLPTTTTILPWQVLSFLGLVHDVFLPGRLSYLDLVLLFYASYIVHIQSSLVQQRRVIVIIVPPPCSEQSESKGFCLIWYHPERLSCMMLTSDWMLSKYMNEQNTSARKGTGWGVIKKLEWLSHSYAISVMILEMRSIYFVISL